MSYRSILGPLCRILVLTGVLLACAPERPGQRFPADLPPRIDDAVEAYQVATAEYHATPTPKGLRASNPAQNLQSNFDTQGVVLTPGPRAGSGPDSRFSWKTTGIGRTGSMREVAEAAPEAAGNRVTYRRENWSEWYVNTPAGLEQGFTVDRRPPGEGPLRVVGEFPETLRAEARSDGAYEFLDHEGACVIRYGKLLVWDADGDTLGSELAVDGTELAIVVDDRDAAYPVTIDPLMTSPAWAVESDQAFANMGVEVGTAGDVNGDGFSDVIVTVGWYNDEPGWAFVYHGSATGLATTPAWSAHSSPAVAYSMARTAGDVNGDGFHDVIIGAPSYSNGQASEGRAIVYLGSASGLSTTPAWTVESNQGGSEFGSSVGTAGDVNGDGYADVAVGARFFDAGDINEGAAFVYHGSGGGLATTPAITLQSNVQGAFFGTSVGTAGDVNADGFADVIVGAPNYTNGQAGEGAAFVYPGSPGGTSASPSWFHEGEQVGASLGNAVGTAGDVNGDGYSDIVVGAYQFDNGQNNEGRVLLFQATSTGLPASPSFWREIDQGQLGTSVGTAGDVNGDGFADIIAGAPLYGNGQAQEGIAMVWEGSPGGLTAAAWSGEGNQIGASMGQSVATAGDVNGDGRSDIIVGAPYFDSGQEDEGVARVFYGSSSSGLFMPTSFGVLTPLPGARFGSLVAAAGDLNGDGVSDFLVTAPGADNGKGRVFVYATSTLGTPEWDLAGLFAGENFGSSAAGAGDVNGDGYGDLIVGADQYDGGHANQGRVVVFHGSATGLATIPFWSGVGKRAQANFGTTVATAGDVNGDGYSDVLIGEHDETLGLVGQWRPWRAYVYHGSSHGLEDSPAWSVSDSIPAQTEFQFQVATAGDVNGDGYSDVILNGPTCLSSGALQKRAFVYHGSPAGLGSAPAWSAEVHEPTDDLVSSAVTAGDVNGDGFSDVLVGNRQSGKLDAYHGSAEGLLPFPMWTIYGPNGFGQSVASAGDRDGDGYSDIIVGHPSYTNGQNLEGRVLAYHGSAGGLSTFPAWTMESDESLARLGQSVSACGDGGTGYSSVVMGMPGALLYGRVWVGTGNSFFNVFRRPQQMRTQAGSPNVPVSLLGRVDSNSSVRLRAVASTAAGRDVVRLQVEVKPFGVPFDGTGLITGPAANTGAPVNGFHAVELEHIVTGLSPGQVYHWRLRILGGSPFFPRTNWFSPDGNAWSEADFRTPALVTSVEEASSPSRPHLAAAPNPFTSVTQFTYVLSEAGRCKLSLYDVRGRHVSTLMDGFQPAGHHATRWDGRDKHGMDLPGGVYFLWLEAEDITDTRKVVIAR